ncbi:MAG TPA: insulinase family protein [Phycisphaerae bacterium]|nr:insulinase family protein [Phycisphaerae bacterium]
MNRQLLSTLAVVIAAASAMPVRAENLPSDDRIQTGTFDNGLKWMYRQHNNPPGRMAMMIHVSSGSLNEKESQRGLAHFLEHMAFNGTENFAPGELIKFFESIGMEFGADLNAFTSFNQTSYMLFTPENTTAQVDEGMMALSDYVFRALLPQEEIDKERGVVISEWRSGRGAQQRVFDQLIENILGGTRFAARIPIGLPEVLKTANRDEFVDYYRTWYRPELMTLMVVGDAPLEQIKPIMEKWFGQYKATVPARKQESAGFKPFVEQRAFVFSDPELSDCDVSLYNISPGRPPITTVEQARVEMVENVANWIVNRRLEERVQKGSATYQRSRVSVGNFFNEAMMVDASANGEPGAWNKMLDELIVELSRAKEHGFTERELELAKKEILADAKRDVEREPTRNARGMLFEMNGAVTNEEPVLSAEQQLALTEKLLPTITTEELAKAFNTHFGAQTFAYVVTAPKKDDIKLPTSEEVLAAAKAAWNIKTEPIKEETTPTELLATAPKPGKVVEEKTDDDLKITSAWLDNGVRVHHRFMDYKKDQVMLSINLAGGRIEENESNRGEIDLAAYALSAQPATNRLTSTNVRDIMTGHTIGVGVSPTRDTVMLTVIGSPKELETGLKLAHALLTDGKVEESAVNVWRQQQKQQRVFAQALPQFKAYEALMDAISGSDPRLMPLLPEDRVEALSADAAQKRWNSFVAKAPIEVAIVGEIPLDRAMALASQYIGSLPKRERSASYIDALRTVARKEGPLVRNIDVNTMTDKGMAIAGFMGCEANNVHDSRALELSSEILTSRLIRRIREELAIVYSLSASNRPSSSYRDSGMFMSQAPCEPTKAQQVVEEAHKIFDDFAKNGPSDEELSNAKKQVKNNLDEEMKEPGYWFSVLQQLDFHGMNLADEKQLPDAFDAFTAKDLVDVFGKYYKPARLFRITAVPSGTDEKAKEAEKTATTTG